MKVTFLTLAAMLFFAGVYGQTFTINSGLIQTSSGYFYDSGGPSQNYKGGEDYVCVVTTPDKNATLFMRFQQFNLDEGDWMEVYDGSSIESALIETYSSENPLIGDLKASNGSLTFVFHSDYNSNATGWVAYISNSDDSNVLPQQNPSSNAKVQLIYKITGLLSADEGDIIEQEMQKLSFVKFCEVTVEKEIIVVNTTDTSYISEARHSILESCHDLGRSVSVEFVESVNLNN